MKDFLLPERGNSNTHEKKYIHWPFSIGVNVYDGPGVKEQKQKLYNFMTVFWAEKIKKFFFSFTWSEKVV